jgi:hypothetical protein
MHSEYVRILKVLFQHSPEETVRIACMKCDWGIPKYKVRQIFIIYIL